MWVRYTLKAGMAYEVIEHGTFDPARFSLEDVQFLIDHLGEPIEQATAKGWPHGVTPSAGGRALDELYRFGKRCEQNGDPFCGFEALREACRVFLREYDRMMRDHRRGAAPKFPSLYEWDSMGRPHLGGVGSDSDRLRSYFDEQGHRKFFAVKLLDTAVQVPSWLAAKQKATIAADEEFTDLVEDPEHGVVTCPICKFSQNYEPGSRGRRSLARNRMAKHLKGAKREPDRHRQLYTRVFGS